ncbi:hypothetical protein L1987_77246 [Smallanthus sonchifolius]|uniref:Uncharacterized protein n=1 Tax=Smallanthus sonchifolius TaxID=185202 RepID=A0ACB8Z8G4_9ASTR|nr:hypothetical protein L1987_77246 [Smallanthus sonchifolius]
MAHYPKNTTHDLSKIGKETFDSIDDIFPKGRRSKHPSEATGTSQGYHYHQYQPQQAYVIQHQLYDAPVAARVINCNEAAKMYGGTVFVDYPKRKPARRGFFF